MFLINIFLSLAAIVCLIFLARLLLYRTALIHVVRKWAHWIDDRIHVHQQFRVPELDENGRQNMFYRKVYLYVNSLQSVEDSDFTNLFSGKKSSDIVLHLDDDQVVRDTFIGATISWTNQVQRHQGTRSFLLKIKKKDKRRILRPYLQHIHTVSDDIERRTDETKLFFLNNLPSLDNTSIRRWRSVPFTHPSTFDTIVLDGDLKSKTKSDLDAFLKSEQYYGKLGRVWKRSYLLHGPSGTGKSSFIAAMANYLSFDVYDVDLSRVSDYADLKMLLLQTSSKSVIVIEDLDIFVTEKSMVSLTGMLNFMDGIANSCCGDAKIMIFTVKSKDSVDSALLRPGRIDVHIHFPLCDFNSFKSLANSYLGVKEHKLFPQVEEMFQCGATISPAAIGELMLVNRSSPSRALKSVISAMQTSAAEGRSSSVNLAHRSSESASSSPLPPLPSSEHGSGTWREATPAKEFRKLYGLLRLKSNKRSGPSDLDSEMIER